jgi:hypothetical protein
VTLLHRIVPVSGFYEHGSEASYTVTLEDFLVGITTVYFVMRTWELPWTYC